MGDGSNYCDVVTGRLLAVSGNGRLAPAASLTWGLARLAAAHISGDLQSIPVAVATIIGAALVDLVTITLRLKAARYHGSLELEILA